MKTDQTIKNIVNKISIEEMQSRGSIYTILDNYYRLIREDIAEQKEPRDYKTFIIPSLGKFTIKHSGKIKKDEYIKRSTDSTGEGGEEDRDL